MTSKKLPAFQFYPGDWRKDMGIQSLSFHDRGVWFEILCFMHESEERGKLILNGAPMSNESLAKLLGLDNQILTTTLTKLLESGVASKDSESGALFSRRMVRDEYIRNIRKNAGSLGGNPNLLNQIPTPSSSSSSSSSKELSEKVLLKQNGSEEVSLWATFHAPVKRIFGKPSSHIAEAEIGRLLPQLAALPAVSPEELERRVGIYREAWPGVPCTLKAVIKNWDVIPGLEARAKKVKPEEAPTQDWLT